MTASEVVDADGLAGCGVAAAEACEDADVVEAAEVEVPLVLTGGGERLEVLELDCECTLLLELRRVLPTSLLKRLFSIGSEDASPRRSETSSSPQPEGFALADKEARQRVAGRSCSSLLCLQRELIIAVERQCGLVTLRRDKPD